jgi:predicted glycosyltransferase
MNARPLRIWVDLANSPQVLFFLPLIRRWTSEGHSIAITTRPYAQTVALGDHHGLSHTPIGLHGGTSLGRIGGQLLRRARLLRRWARSQRFDLAVSHNSYAQIVAARTLGLRVATSMDYEFQAANHLAFRLADRVVVPRCFPAGLLRRFGAGGKARPYDGIKEEMYLADFTPTPDFRAAHGFAPHRILVVVRPAADWALYHRFENRLAPLLLERLSGMDGVDVLFLPRVPEQGDLAQQLYPRIQLPARAVDGPDLLASADAVFSAGGTMAREAAVLGTPAFSLFAGRTPAVDELLVRQGRLTILRTREDLDAIVLHRTTARDAGQPTGQRLVGEVSALLLDPNS